MGGWRNRPRRRKHSPHRYYFDHYDHWSRHRNSNNSDFSSGNVPHWEKKFCTLVGSVPWRKVVVCKDFICFHDNILNWDDSASKEAFRNAKKKFWEEINGFPCSISFPDPDMYIEDIDWNPDIDPQLIKELETAFFNPDDMPKDDEAEGRKIDLSSDSSDARCDNLDKSNNPWESSKAVQSCELKNLWNSSQRANKNDSANGHMIGNPWERCEQAMKESSWGAPENKASGWNQWGSGINKNNNPWASANNNIQVDVQRSSQTNWVNFRSRDGNINHAMYKNQSWSSNERWRGNSSTLQDYSERGNRSNAHRRGGISGAWSGSNRKREGPYHNSPSYGFQGTSYRTDQWSRERANKRVSFG